MSTLENELDALGFEETATAAEQPEPKRRKRAKRIAGIIGAALIAAAIAVAIIVLVGMLVAPDQTEKIVGETTTAVTHSVRKVAGVEPKVILGQVGDQADIDSCPGYWVHMASYNNGTGFDVPVYSAHNGCVGFGDRGDVILPLGIGDTIQIEDEHGVTRSHKVTEIRNLPQHSTTTDALKGMSGPLILQTCYWDNATMKFISVTPIG